MDGIGDILLELYRAARESPLIEFQERAVALAKSLCRFDSAIAATARLDSAAGLSFQSIALFNIDEAFIGAHDEIAEGDIISEEVAKLAGTACVFNMRDLMPARRFPKVAAFDGQFALQNLLGQMEIENGTGLIRGFFLWRAKVADRFSEDDRRLGEALLPHIIEAAAMNRHIWLNELTASSIARRGVRAIASERGVLLTYDASFLDLLRLEWPDWSPPVLPATLLHALRASPHRRHSGAEIAIACEPTHGMLFLLAREKAGGFGLTPGQLSVARLVADGRTYKEVAAQLNLSVATVRNHLHAAYGKLGVHNKTALARLLSWAVR